MSGGTQVYNDSGAPIQRNDLTLRNLRFGYKDQNGRLVIFWKEEDDCCDSNGFSKLHLEENGYYIQTILLKRGAKLARYGSEGGRFTTEKGTDYDLLSLPYQRNSIEYHQYEVLSDVLPVQCFVTRGQIAPMFDSPGGAIQYMHEQKIALEIEDGKLKEDFSWITKMN